MTDHTLPPEVEEVIQEFVPRLVVDEARGVYYPRDTLRAHITAQAEEIERLENYAEGLKLGASITRRQRDRYKAMAEWLAKRLGVISTPGMRGWTEHEEPEQTWERQAAEWLKAAEEATRD